MTEPTRVAVVGCGKIAGVHAAALRELPQARLVAACDPDVARAEALLGPSGGRAAPDLASALAAERIDAVILCTPHPLHAADAIAAAHAGCHVLVEKPLATTVADCDAMIAAAEQAGVVLSVVSQRRWYPSVRRMKEAIRGGRIGRPILATFTMLSWRDAAYYASDPWRGRWDTEGGGVLINQSPHMLDLLLWLVGPVAEVSARWDNLNHPTIDVEDTVVATLRFAGGALGAITASVSQKPGLYTKVHVHGASGASVGVETDRGATFIAGVSEIAEPPLNDVWTIPGEEDALAEFEAADRRHFASVDPIQYYHRLQLEDFLRAATTGAAPSVTGRDGRDVVELIETIYRCGRPDRTPA